MAVTVNGERPKLIDPSTGEPFKGYDDGFAVAPVLNYASIINQSMQVYSAIRRDDAVRFGRRDALAMERDTYLQSLMLERYEATALLKWHIEPEDPKDEDQKAEAEFLQKVIERTPYFQQYRMSLLYAIWFGRAGVQHVISRKDWRGQPLMVRGRPAWGIRAHSPVRGDKIEFTYQFPRDENIEEGTPCVFLHGGYSDEVKRLGGRVIQTDLSQALLLTPGYWRERFVVHKHLTKDFDPFEDPEKAGTIHGFGVRDQIFYMDWVRKEWLANVSDFIDQVGKGCQLYPYDASNPEARERAMEAAKKQSRNTIIVWPVWPGQANALPQPMNVPMEGSKVLLELMQHMEGIIERYIIGQTGSSRSDAQGLGTHSTGFMEDCVPVEGSEILTRRGFKTASEVEVGEEVLAYDCDTDSCRWTPLLGKTFYEDRAVSRLSTGTRKGFEAVCTPKHSWATVKQADPSARGLVEARNLAGKVSVILAAPELEDEGSLLTPTEAAILGWAVTDGHIRRTGRGYRVGICQSKAENFEEIRSLVSPLGTYEWEGKPFRRTFPTGNTSECLPQHWWYLPRAASNDLLAKCGYRTKADLPGIVTRLSHAARSAMLCAFMKAEADAKGVFANKDRHVMEAFEILCALQGLATGRLVRKKTCDVKTVKKSRVAYTQYLKLEDAGRCDIWCPSTKYGTWVMRQNGRVMVTGNTKYRRVRWDCQNLDETLTEQLVAVLHRWNFPKSRFKHFFKSEIDKPNALEMLKAGQVLYSMNTKVKKDELLAYAGYTKPEDGDEVAYQLADKERELQLQMAAQGDGGQEAQAKASAEAQKHQQQMQADAQKHRLEVEKMKLELQHAEKKHALEMRQALQKQEIDREVAVQAAQIKMESSQADAQLRQREAATRAATQMAEAQRRAAVPPQQGGPV